MTIVYKAIEYIKNNPKSKYSYLLSWLYTIASRNSIKVRRGNILNKKNTFLKRCRIIVNGTGNIIDFGEGANSLTNCLIYISGNNNNVRLGVRNVLINGELWIEDNGGSIIMGSHNQLLGKTHIAECEGTSISFGDNCLFSTDVIFRTSDSHAIFDTITGERINPAKLIVVGDRVWFGNKTTILKGVNIGNDSIIGTGSVVTKDVPNNCIVAGNPAKVVKSDIKWNIHRK